MEVYLTDAGKAWVREHYSQGVVRKYDSDKSLKHYSIITEYIELTHLGVPYRIPHKVDGKPTIRMERK